MTLVARERHVVHICRAVEGVLSTRPSSWNNLFPCKRLGESSQSLRFGSQFHFVPNFIHYGLLRLINVNKHDLQITSENAPFPLNILANALNANAVVAICQNYHSAVCRNLCDLLAGKKTQTKFPAGSENFKFERRRKNRRQLQFPGTPGCSLGTSSLRGLSGFKWVARKWCLVVKERREGPGTLIYLSAWGAKGVFILW